MSDDLDDLVRRAMKTLDDQVPSGYFEDLPNRTLARLEGTMQPTGTGTDRDRSSGVPPVTEDSGLHDIRNLAQSTKQRLSNKRISTGPVVPTDEDLIATSSAGWKAAVALPEPAAMVSLPALDELPSKKEVLAKAKPAVEAEQPELRERFSRPTAPKSKSRAPLAIAGVLVAAAAGVAVWFAFGQQSESKSAANERTVAVAAPAPAPVQQAAAPKAPEPPPAPTVESIKEEPAPPPADEQPAAAPEPAKVAVATSPKHSVSKKAPPAPPKTADKPAEKPAPAAETKVEVKKDTGKKGKGGEEGEPNFDDLLKEAGVDKQKKIEKPKLANSQLSGEDFKKGMNAVAGKASACYKGTQGTASFKLIVAPSGQVSKVTVTGAFAGKPEADCVEKAVRSASFPAWDGGPQTFSYSYLLSD
jgi:hypothetical protein